MSISNLKSLSFPLICFHLLYHSMPFVVIRCITRCHLLSSVVTRCHSLSLVKMHCYSLSLVVSLVDRCHSLSLIAPLAVICCHSFPLLVKKQTSDTSSDNEWQEVTTSGTTSDKEWYKESVVNLFKRS